MCLSMLAEIYILSHLYRTCCNQFQPILAEIYMLAEIYLLLGPI